MNRPRGRRGRMPATGAAVSRNRAVPQRRLGGVAGQMSRPQAARYADLEPRGGGAEMPLMPDASTFAAGAGDRFLCISRR
jgi:hypothetical protein